MKNSKFYFQFYHDSIRDVIGIIEKLDISKRDCAFWDVIHLISFDNHGDWIMWILENEPYLMDLTKYSTFEELPGELKKTVFRSICRCKNVDFLNRNKNNNESRITGRIAYNTHEDPVNDAYIKNAQMNGVRVIFSKSGYTKCARSLARKYWINCEE